MSERGWNAICLILFVVFSLLLPWTVLGHSVPLGILLVLVGMSIIFWRIRQSA